MKQIPKILCRRDTPSSASADCNCDCACPLPTERLSLLDEMQDIGLQILSPTPQETCLVTANDLYVAPLEEDYHLAFSPFAENGQVVVMNSATQSILQLFTVKRSIGEAIDLASQKGIEPGAAVPAIGQLQRLSILVSEDWRPVPASRPIDVLTAWLHVTNECNLRCTYCYLNKTSDDMTLDVGKRAVDSVFRSARAHGFRSVKLKFAGGEATLNFDLVVQLYDYAATKAKQFNLSLQAVVLSNGIGITHHMAEALLRRGMKLMISLDGVGSFNDAQRVFANGKGSFKIVSGTIDRLLEWGLAPEISITITDRNIDGLPSLLRYVLERNLTFSLNFYRENDCSVTLEELRYSDEHMMAGMEAAYQVIQELLPERSLLGAVVDRANFGRPHSKTCRVGENYVVIDERGNVAKCQMAIKNTVGTVNAPDIVALIQEDQIGIRNLPVQEKEGCRDCTWRTWCTGGCALYTYRATGRYDVKSPNCRIYKSIYPQLLRLEGLRILRLSQRDQMA